jgi:hypothetical protein
LVGRSSAVGAGLERLGRLSVRKPGGLRGLAVLDGLSGGGEEP